jgi:Cdc6-like AAA superfamily ATPase
LEADMQNPFTLTFGRSPLESVDRPVQINEIIENFTADTINQQMFIITGVRGSGKTVMMTEISHKLRENDDWVVIELNPAKTFMYSLFVIITVFPEPRTPVIINIC